MIPRNQIHTAKRVLDRLVAEYGFADSYSEGATAREEMAGGEQDVSGRISLQLR